MFLLLLEPLPVHASTSIVFDSFASNNCNGLLPAQCGSLSWSHTVGSGGNGILIVGVSYVPSLGSTSDSVKFGTTSLSLLGSHPDCEQVGFGGGAVVQLWSLLNPPTGTATVTITFNAGPDLLVGGSVSYFNVASTGTVASNDEGCTRSSPGSVSVASSSGDLVVDILCMVSYVGYNTANAEQTQRYSSTYTSGGFGINIVGAESDQPDPPVTMTWDFPTPNPPFTDPYWSLIGVPLTPAATTTTTTAPPIPEYPLGLPILAILIVLAYGLIRRRTLSRALSN